MRKPKNTSNAPCRVYVLFDEANRPEDAPINWDTSAPDTMFVSVYPPRGTKEMTSFNPPEDEQAIEGCGVHPPHRAGADRGAKATSSYHQRSLRVGETLRIFPSLGYGRHGRHCPRCSAGGYFEARGGYDRSTDF